jgi:hypothetical protein
MPKSKLEIEQLIITEMRTFADCENALEVEVVSVPMMDYSLHTATWTVACFNPGKSDGDACDRALQQIVPCFQRAYDLVQKH